MGKFKQLRVWQDAIDLATVIYNITRQTRFSRDFGLRDQIRKAAVSVSSNIAEGDERNTNKESVYFFHVAKGSIAEVITQLHIAHNIGYIDEATLHQLEEKAGKIAASLKNLIKVRQGR